MEGNSLSELILKSSKELEDKCDAHLIVGFDFKGDNDVEVHSEIWAAHNRSVLFMLKRVIEQVSGELNIPVEYICDIIKKIIVKRKKFYDYPFPEKAQVR